MYLYAADVRAFYALYRALKAQDGTFIISDESELSFCGRSSNLRA